MPTREFDVVLYGATGFTGRQTVRYFHKFAPPDLRWAIAGRNQSTLEALNSGVPVMVADSSNQNAIDKMVERTRVMLSTAGPFALYGTGIVDACVRFRTHYCDITGETPWVRSLIDRYQDQATAEGTRLIPFSGFDSIPSDLGAMLVAGALGPQTTTVKAFFQISGGLNGGTLASALNMAETGADKLMRDPFLLSPLIQRPLKDLERDPTAGAFDEDAQTWVAPFVMGAINTRVVRRSCQILGVDFAYQEYLKMHGGMAGPHRKSRRSSLDGNYGSPGEQCARERARVARKNQRRPLEKACFAVALQQLQLGLPQGFRTAFAVAEFAIEAVH
jgi:short subunit dehydrogenase-like uncharacterized protein